MPGNRLEDYLSFARTRDQMGVGGRNEDEILESALTWVRGGQGHNAANLISWRPPQVEVSVPEGVVLTDEQAKRLSLFIEAATAVGKAKASVMALYDEEAGCFPTVEKSRVEAMLVGLRIQQKAMEAATRLCVESGVMHYSYTVKPGLEVVDPHG